MTKRMYWLGRQLTNVQKRRKRKAHKETKRRRKQGVGLRKATR